MLVLIARNMMLGVFHCLQLAVLFRKKSLMPLLILILSLGLVNIPSSFALNLHNTSRLNHIKTDTLYEAVSQQAGPYHPGIQRHNRYTGLQAVEDDDLNGRQPLILIHGIGGSDSSKYSEWGDFLSYVKEQSAFEKHFKIYVFHYDSSQSVTSLSNSLQRDLIDFLKMIPPYQKIKLVGYSEGGLLIRNALQSPVLNRQVEQVITLATPFHGSPLASKSWFTFQVNQESWLAPLRVSRRIAYWVAAKKFPSFENDFHWDNVDQVIGKPFLVDKIPAPTDYALQYKPNFITYGGFFGTSDNVDEQMVKSLALTVPLPHERRAVYLGRRLVFNVVNRSIGRIGRIVAQVQTQTKPSLRAATNMEENHVLLAAANQAINDASIPEPEQALDVGVSTISMMPFNDGISPISSSLWLGRFSQQITEKNPSKRLWTALRSLKGKDQARLFPGMDHRNWIEGQTRMSSNLVPDLLNPQHSPKSIFDWLVSDLMGHEE